MNKIAFSFIVISTIWLSTNKCTQTTTSSSSNLPSTNTLNQAIAISSEDIQLMSRDSLFVSMQRTPCFGFCPTYSIKIYKKGFVVYYGKAHVDSSKLGYFTGKINREDIVQIAENIMAIDYFNLKNQYPNPKIIISDLPSTITMVKYNNKIKTITNKLYAPKTLISFENYMDTLVNNITLIKTID